ARRTYVVAECADKGIAVDCAVRIHFGDIVWIGNIKRRKIRRCKAVNLKIPRSTVVVAKAQLIVRRLEHSIVFNFQIIQIDKTRLPHAKGHIADMKRIIPSHEIIHRCRIYHRLAAVPALFKYLHAVGRYNRIKRRKGVGLRAGTDPHAQGSIARTGREVIQINADIRTGGPDVDGARYPMIGILNPWRIRSIAYIRSKLLCPRITSRHTSTTYIPKYHALARPTTERQPIDIVRNNGVSWFLTKK